MIPRKLSHLDKSRLITHLSSLQGEDRRLRFGSVVNDDYIANYINNSFDKGSKWFGVDHIDGHIVAACHVSVRDKTAELGCSVDADFRGQGFAQLMFDRAVTWLRTRNVTLVYMYCLSENAAMKHIAKKNDMVVVSCCGDSEAEVRLEEATPLTLVADAYIDRMSIIDMVYKNNFRIIKNIMPKYRYDESKNHN